MIPNRWF